MKVWIRGTPMPRARTLVIDLSATKAPSSGWLEWLHFVWFVYYKLYYLSLITNFYKSLLWEALIKSLSQSRLPSFFINEIQIFKPCHADHTLATNGGRVSNRRSGRMTSTWSNAMPFTDRNNLNFLLNNDLSINLCVLIWIISHPLLPFSLRAEWS